MKRTNLNEEGRTVFLSVKRISKFGAGANQASELTDKVLVKAARKLFLRGKAIRRVPKCNWR